MIANNNENLYLVRLTVDHTGITGELKLPIVGWTASSDAIATPVVAGHFNNSDSESSYFYEEYIAGSRVSEIWIYDAKEKVYFHPDRFEVVDRSGVELSIQFSLECMMVDHMKSKGWSVPHSAALTLFKWADCIEEGVNLPPIEVCAYGLLMDWEGEWYGDTPRVSDSEVIAFLAKKNITKNLIEIPSEVASSE